MQARHRKSFQQYKLASSYEGHASHRFWLLMDEMDLIVYLHNKIFGSGQWGSSRLLSRLKRSKARRPAFPLPIHFGNGGFELSP